MPAVQNLPQQEENREALENGPTSDEEEEAPRTYRAIPVIQLDSRLYVNNLYFKYYYKKLLVNRIRLVCERIKNPFVLCVMVQH